MAAQVRLWTRECGEWWRRSSPLPSFSLIFTAVTLAALSLAAGCAPRDVQQSTIPLESWSTAPADALPAHALQSDLGGAVRLRRLEKGESLPILVTRRNVVPLFWLDGPTPPLVFRAVDGDAWRSVSLDADLGVPVVRGDDATGYLIATRGAEETPLLRLEFDRTPPLVWVRRDQDERARISLRWRIEDRFPLREPMTLELGRDGEQEFRSIAVGAGEESGEFLWPLESVEHDRFRIVARDLVGNETHFSLLVWDSALAGVWQNSEEWLQQIIESADWEFGLPFGGEPVFVGDLDEEEGDSEDAHSIDGEPVSTPSRTGESAESDDLPMVAEGTSEVARDTANVNGEQPTPLGPREAEAPGPRALNFAGETLRGGGAHYFFFSGFRSTSPRDEADVDVELRLVPLEGGAAARSVVASGGAGSVLVELPRATGDYTVELHWQDATGVNHSVVNEEPLRIDADPPEVVWGTVPEVASTRASILVDSPHDRLETLSEWRLWRLVDGRWEFVPSDRVQTNAQGEHTVELLVDTSRWEEGEWPIAVEAVDAVGNRSPRLGGPLLRIDRSAPDADGWKIASPVEGIPLRLQWTRGGQPPLTTMLVAGGDRYEIEWQGSTRDGWSADGPVFPAGRVTLVLSGEDRAGNRTERRVDLDVVEAVLSLGSDPADRVVSGRSLWIDYELRAPHPAPSLALRVVPVDERGEWDSSGTPGEARPIERRRGRVRLDAPGLPGRYRVVIESADGAWLHAAAPLEVVADVAVRVVRAVGGDEGAIKGATAKDADLLTRFREFRSQWEQGERGFEVVQARSRLRDALQSELRARASWTAGRRALAQLYALDEPPDLAKAAELLRAHLEDPANANDPRLPEVLNDLAAVELAQGATDSAERRLLAALELEESARRRYNLGQVYAASGRYDEAEVEYRRAVEGEPRTLDFLREWARTVVELPASRVSTAREQLDLWVEGGSVSQEHAREVLLLWREGGQE